MTESTGTANSRPSIVNSSTLSREPSAGVDAPSSGIDVGILVSGHERLGVEDENGGRVPEIRGSGDAWQVPEEAADRLDHNLLAADEPVDDDPDLPPFAAGDDRVPS